MRIALATCEALPSLLPDERLLADALKNLGHEVRAEIWSSDYPDWSSYDAVMIRTTWDYTENIREYLQWNARIEELGIPLLNNASAVRWNFDKTYLNQLAEVDVPIVPTVFIDPSEKRSLEELVAETGWERVVLKPTLSASARRSYAFTADRADEYELALRDVLSHSSGMLQPFMDSIGTDGEYSLLYFEGNLSHTVNKLPPSGEWRSQPKYGSTVQTVEAPATAVETADLALKTAPGDHLYARVDLVTANGGFQLMELELIEPQLYIEQHPASAKVLADLLVARLK